jgi:hypothetical protein
MELDITIESLGTVVGGSAAVALVLLVLRGVFKEYWLEIVNRIAAFVLSVGVVEFALYATGTVDWKAYVLGFFVGCQVTLSVLGGTQSVVRGITQNRTLKLTSKDD